MIFLPQHPRVAVGRRARRAGWRPVAHIAGPARRGISLTEVLIAMGILTVGLLGVASVFPVGSFFMQKGEVADRGSAIAQAAFNEALSRGDLDPNNWYVMCPVGWNSNADHTNIKNNVDGASSNNAMFRRPFVAAFNERISAGDSNRQLSRRMGNVFLIDPIGAAALADLNQPTALRVWQAVALPFPGNATVTALNSASPSYFGAPQWSTWFENATGEKGWPIRRVTLLQPNITGTVTPLGRVPAEHRFSSTDDLAQDTDTPASKPSKQNMDVATFGSGKLALARQSRGEYSWIISVMPTSAEARNALARGGQSQAFEVSVAVFHKRILPSAVPVDETEMKAAVIDERLVKARVVSSGLSGGEVLLERINEEVPGDPFANLKTGNWILLSGPHPSSSDANPLFIARWYRVTAIDKQAAGINPTTQRLVTLRGPQWPWQPEPSGNWNDNTHLSNTLCAALPSNVVAVHSKTIQLEGNSSWSVR